MAISTGLGRARLWKLFFWSFLSSCTKIKQDQALPSHAYGKFLPHITKFWLGFLGSSSILILIFFLVGGDVLYVQMPCLCFKSLCFTAKNCMRQTNSKSGSQPKTTRPQVQRRSPVARHALLLPFKDHLRGLRVADEQNQELLAASRRMN